MRYRPQLARHVTQFTGRHRHQRREDNTDMRSSAAIAVGVLATTALLGGSVAACGNKSSSPSSSSSKASSTTSASGGTSSGGSPTSGAASGGYANLLIKASDINIPGDTFTMQAPMENPGGSPGVAGQFSNQAGTRIIGDTIMILPDPAAATTSLEGGKGALGSSVVGDPQSVSVGTGGTLVSGNSPDGAKSVTVL